MDRKKMSLVVVLAVIASLAVTCVTANSLTSNTPLYTLRMEQASSKMNFLPTAVNEFTYTAEKGYELICDIEGNCGINGNSNDADPLGLDASWEPTECVTCYTYCGDTCTVPTCPYTCENTCPSNTCSDPTCPDTCHDLRTNGNCCDP